MNHTRRGFSLIELMIVIAIIGRFAPSLAELGPPESGESNAAGADLVDSDLAAGVGSGYRFSVAGNTAGYVVSAVPLTYNSTGTLSFYSDQTMRIRQNQGPGPASAQSPLVRH